MTGLQGALGKLKTFALGAFAVFAGSQVLGKFIRETEESQAALAQLNIAFQNSGESSRRSKQDLLDFSAATQKITAFSDEAVTKAQTALLRFGRVTGETFNRARKDILDVAAAMGVDLETAALGVGRALEAPSTGLRQLRALGVIFSESQQKLIQNLEDTGQIAKADTIILDALEARFQGAAKEAGQTLGGALERLKNSFNDLFELSEKSGSQAVDGINQLTVALSDPKLKAGVDFIVGELGSWAAAFLHDVQLSVEGLKFIASFATHETPTRLDEAFSRQSNLGASLNKALEEQASAKRGGDAVLERQATARIENIRKQMEEVQQQIKSFQAGGGGPQKIGSRQVTAPGSVKFISEEQLAQEKADKLAATLKSLDEIHPTALKQELTGLAKLMDEWDKETQTAGERASHEFEALKIKLNELGVSADEYRKRVEEAIDAQLQAIDTNAIAARKLVEPLSAQQQALRNGIDTLKQGLANLALSGQTTGKAILRYLLSALESKALMRAIDALGSALEKAVLKGTSGKSGGLSSFLGVIGSLLGSFGHAAGGGRISGATIVGEDGPELAFGSGQVFNRRQMQFAMAGSPTINMGDTEININGGNADPQQIAALVEVRLRQSERRQAEAFTRRLKENGFGDLR